MIKEFEKYEEFEETYEFYLNNGGLYLYKFCAYPQRTFWQKLFGVYRDVDVYKHDHADENGYCSLYGIYLARVVEIEDLCPRLESVDIKYIDQNGKMFSNRVKINDLYHYAFPSDEVERYYLNKNIDHFLSNK